MAKTADRGHWPLVSSALALALVLVLLGLGFLAASPVRAAEATASVRVVKYAADQETVAAEKQVDFRWMEANLPVQGDGRTHYYHQGPVFEGDKWDPTRTKNLKDEGAVKGTDLKDLCDLVGGMAPGDEVVISASDGYYITLGYENVYRPSDRQGPVVLCWYNGEEANAGERQGKGYVPDYFQGMRLVFMSRVPNAEGRYVFGNMDMKECLAQEKYWHYYEGMYPSTSGLTVKWVNRIAVYPGGAPEQPVPPAADHAAGPEPAPPRAGRPSLWLPAAAGVAVIVLALYLWKRK